MTEADKITVLLHEYDTLRDEIVQGSGPLQQMSLGAVIVLGALTIALTDGLDESDRLLLYGSLAVCMLVLGFSVWKINRGVQKIARRLRELESEINRRAGEPLLQWETHWGGAVAGFWKATEWIVPLRSPTEDSGDAPS